MQRPKLAPAGLGNIFLQKPPGAASEPQTLSLLFPPMESDDADVDVDVDEEKNRGNIEDP